MFTNPKFKPDKSKYRNFSFIFINFIGKAEKLLKPRYEEEKKDLISGEKKQKKTLISRTIMGNADSHESYHRDLFRQKRILKRK